MQESPSLENHAIPHKPTFRQSEPCEALGISRATLAKTALETLYNLLPQATRDKYRINAECAEDYGDPSYFYFDEFAVSALEDISDQFGGELETLWQAIKDEAAEKIKDRREQEATEREIENWIHTGR